MMGWRSPRQTSPWVMIGLSSAGPTVTVPCASGLRKPLSDGVGSTGANATIPNSSDAYLPSDFDNGLEIGWKVDLPGRVRRARSSLADKVIVTASSGVAAGSVARAGLRCRRWASAVGAPFLGDRPHADASSNGRCHADAGKRWQRVFLPSSRRTIWLRSTWTETCFGIADWPRIFPGWATTSACPRRRWSWGKPSSCKATVKEKPLSPGSTLSDGTTRWQLDRERTATWTSPALLRRQIGRCGGAGGIDQIDQRDRPGHGRGAVEPRTGLRYDRVGLRRRWTGLCAGQGADRTASRRHDENARGRLEKQQIAMRRGQPDGLRRPCLRHQSWRCDDRRRRRRAARFCRVLGWKEISGARRSWPTSRVLALSFEGVGQLVEMSDDGQTGKVVGKIPFGETLQASPAVSSGAVFVRGDGHLWKLVAGAENRSRLADAPAAHSDPS